MFRAAAMLETPLQVSPQIAHFIKMPKRSQEPASRLVVSRRSNMFQYLSRWDPSSSSRSTG